MGKCGSVPEEEDTSPQEQQLQQIAVTVNGVNKNDTPKHSSTNGTQAPQTQPSSTSPTPQPATTDAPISQPTQSTQQHLSPQPISPQKDSVISTQVTFHSTHESPSHHSQPSSHSNIPIDIKMDATEIAKTLKNVPLLSKLTDPERESLSKALSVRTFQDSQRIVSQGEQGNEFFIIKEGTARVTRLISETNKEVELCFLKKGDYFGEKALLKNTPREATIQAVGPITCFSLDQKKFREMFGSDRLNVTFAKRAAVSAEAYNRENEHKIVHAPPNANRRKTSDQKSMIMGVVRNNILFQNLNPEQQGQVVDTMWLMDVKAGTSVIKQGEPGDNWYVVDHGVFDIYVLKENKQNKVATRGVGTSFGELALMYNSPRAATVTAVVDSSVWAVDRWTFRRILTDASDARLKEYETFLQGVQSFEVLLDYERSKIAEALEEVSYPAGHAIVRQGEQGDTFFILKRGHVVCTVQSKDGVKEVARYKPGDYFGERALVRKEERAATCTAVDDCVCLYLNREAFSLLLGPMEDIFQQRVEGYNLALDPTNTQKRPRTSSAASLSQQPIQQDENFLMTDIKLKDLKVIGTLGKGSFGHVQLVRDERTRQTYALKVVSKAQIVQLGQQEHIMSEKRVMASLNSNFLIRLYATFKDKNCLYFLLEPSLGGELFSVLRAKTFFDEHTARFFAAGVVLAFEYMHARGIIYRDLKPENLLLDSKGYLKITDFGFAKKVGDQRTWTLCGTPDYLAPEVVSGQGHGKGVDWWTLGILIYEMLASYPPFYDEDPMKTYAKIMHGQVAFPMHFSKPAIDLIKRLLHAKATKRLGVVAGGAKLVREHVWFSGFDWEAFEQRRMPAPIVLPVKDAEDLSNFEEYPDEENQWEEYTGDPKNPDWDKDF